MTHGQTKAAFIIGLGLLLLALLVGFDAYRMFVPPIHAKIGPRIFPAIIAGGLAICGLAILWKRRDGFTIPQPEGETDWRAVGLIVLGLIVHMNILKPLGFIPASLLLFMAVAYGFGSRKYLRDVLIGLVLVVITYLAFTKLLGLQLPAGLLKGII